jgi:response regulator RpfG family c-di-GMP phosphodiesterase
VNGVKALQGLVDVHLGSVDSGLLAVNDALTFAKRANASEVPNLLGICIDAYEAAGELDEASVYLNKLVEWKKKSVEAVVNGWQLEGLADAAQLQTDGSLLDVGLLAKARSIQLEGESRLERLFETAVNAEIASGHDIYRPCRLGNLARHVAESLGWSQGRIVRLVWGARLCNIGMIAIPARILVKQEPLSDGESDVLHAHTDYAAELLRKSQLQILDVAALVAKQHHEHYDGSGYPLRLRHGAIAEEARIVSVCDAFDAMTHKSPSRRIPLSIDAALTELAQRANTQFDPQIVNVFVNFIRRELPRHDNFEAFLTDGADDVEYVRVRARIDSSIVGADVLDLSDLG